MMVIKIFTSLQQGAPCSLITALDAILVFKL